ncbi:MAG: GntR family transcriptional regulator / MocR family aminotransferase [Gaiellales bacterium]|nr:GntR family transcriptional regulator / MocR family aminotransferase [Gaiellales bacterium]
MCAVLTSPERRRISMKQIAETLPGIGNEGVAAGVHRLVRLPPGVDDVGVVEAAAARGLRVEPVSPHCIGSISHSGLVRELAAAIRSQR